MLLPVVISVCCRAVRIDAVATIACGQYSAARLVSTLRDSRGGAWRKPIFVLSDYAGPLPGATSVDIRRHQPVFDNEWDRTRWTWRVVKKNSSLSVKWYKTQLFKLLPADVEFVLYLDADVEVVRPIEMFGRALGSPEPSSAHLFRERWYTRRKGGNYNSGIALYHRLHSANLLETWSHVMLSGRILNFDQLALDVALNRCKCRVSVMSSTHVYFAADLLSQWLDSLWMLPHSYTFKHMTGRKSLTAMQQES